ncbi:MAG: LytTR family DNA-binding domain-containing protein [Ginsengibacter sp.]
MKLNCIIVDDEPLARKGIKEYIQKTTFLELQGEANNAVTASQLLAQQKIDLIFLDIQMPEINGVEFVRSLKENVLIIFITAFPDYAVEGYELNVIDYLLKPVSFNRFEKAVLKAKEYHELKNTGIAKHTSDYFFIRCDSKFEKIIFDELLFAEALENYVKLHTKTKTFITYLTFKSMEDYLPANQFIRVHKSFIVSLSKIENLDNEEIKIGNNSIPLSRNYRAEVMNKVIGNNLLRR